MRRNCVIVALLVLAGCSPAEDAGEATVASSTTTTSAPTSTTTSAVEMGITSPAFENGSAVPSEYTCTGEDVSPHLDVNGLPPGTATIAIIVDDPDAPLGTWDHWVEFDIDAGPGQFEIPRDTPQLGVSGINSWRITGYMGPCPPQGEEHTYVFTVYALDGSLGLPEGVTSGDLETAMTGHVLDSAQLTGTYSR